MRLVLCISIWGRKLKFLCVQGHATVQSQRSYPDLFCIDSSHKGFTKKKKKNYPRLNQCFEYERHKNFPFGNLYFYPQRRTYMETTLAGEEVGTAPASQRFLWALIFPWSSFILIPVATTKLSPHLLGLGRQRGWERNTFPLFLPAQGKHNLFPCFSSHNWDRLTYSRWNLSNTKKNLNVNKENKNSTK